MKDIITKKVQFYRETLERSKKEGTAQPTISLTVESVELMLDYIEQTEKEQEQYFDIRMEAVKLLPTIERFINQGFSYDAIHRTEELLNRIIGHK
jgi:hypothetical protein